jgi:hypothetical protein
MSFHICQKRNREIESPLNSQDERLPLSHSDLREGEHFHVSVLFLNADHSAFPKRKRKMSPIPKEKKEEMPFLKQ